MRTQFNHFSGSDVKLKIRMKNVTYAGSGQHAGMGAIAAPQHCGLGQKTDATCMIHYIFEDVQFLNSGTSVSFGASGGSPLAPVYISFDGSLQNDDQVAISPLLDGFRNEFLNLFGPNYPFNGGVHDGCQNTTKML